MAKPWAKKFYNSSAWGKVRQLCIDRSNGLCESCMLKGRYTPGHIVHHKIYLTPDNINDPTIALGLDNLRYDCQDCHNKEHFEKYSPTREDIKFDEKGNVVYIPPKNNEGCVN
ncbi:HNH endonuclease [Arthrobacter citreus]|nr:HNH endonuclease [Arthrobacter citreus]